MHVRLPLASDDAHAGFVMGRNLVRRTRPAALHFLVKTCRFDVSFYSRPGAEELAAPMILRQQAAHRRQQQMAMPTGPLVVLSPAYVVPYETTFFLREKVGCRIPVMSRTPLALPAERCDMDMQKRLFHLPLPRLLSVRKQQCCCRAGLQYKRLVRRARCKWAVCLPAAGCACVYTGGELTMLPER